MIRIFDNKFPFSRCPIDENEALTIDSILEYKLERNKFLLSHCLRTNPKFPQPSWYISIIPTGYYRRKLIFFSHCLHSYIETNFYNVPKENLSQRSHRNVYVPIRISVTLWLCDVYRSKKIEEINLSVCPFVSSPYKSSKFTKFWYNISDVIRCINFKKFRRET